MSISRLLKSSLLLPLPTRLHKARKSWKTHRNPIEHPSNIEKKTFFQRNPSNIKHQQSIEHPSNIHQTSTCFHPPTPNPSSGAAAAAPPASAGWSPPPRAPRPARRRPATPPAAVEARPRGRHLRSGNGENMAFVMEKFEKHIYGILMENYGEKYGIWMGCSLDLTYKNDLNIYIYNGMLI